MKYAYSFDETGAYDCGYTSVQAAIEAARKEVEIDAEDGLKDVNIVYVGKVATKEPEFDGWSVIETMQDYMDNETGGVSTDEGYLDGVSAEQLDKLECIMKDSVKRWSKEAEINVTVTIVTDIKKYDLQTGRELHE
ncbi:hypothetical protein [uncultured Mitsuokella sp.]|uniref:hypothetical protein n=1 Tax=uncultured Mitsuokella sp. TaxID=453120 RepID=UPI0026DCB1B7|nr:hypothetical protein [uncultured Mitsuokella sp.]